MHTLYVHRTKKLKRCHFEFIRNANIFVIRPGQVCYSKSVKVNARKYFPKTDEELTLQWANDNSSYITNKQGEGSPIT